MALKVHRHTYIEQQVYVIVTKNSPYIFVNVHVVVGKLNITRMRLTELTPEALGVKSLRDEDGLEMGVSEIISKLDSERQLVCSVKIHCNVHLLLCTGNLMATIYRTCTNQ